MTPTTLTLTATPGAIAIIDGTMLAVPATVQGVASASFWLDQHHPEADQAAFFHARRIADHPDLICGGIYAPGPLLCEAERRADA